MQQVIFAPNAPLSPRQMLEHIIVPLSTAIDEAHTAISKEPNTAHHQLAPREDAAECPFHCTWRGAGLVKRSSGRRSLARSSWRSLRCPGLRGARPATPTGK